MSKSLSGHKHVQCRYILDVPVPNQKHGIQWLSQVFLFKKQLVFLILLFHLSCRGIQRQLYGVGFSHCYSRFNGFTCSCRVPLTAYFTVLVFSLLLSYCDTQLLASTSFELRWLVVSFVIIPATSAYILDRYIIIYISYYLIKH